MTTVDIVQAIKEALDAGISRMAMLAQRPTIIASESGSDSLELGMLASGKIQWKVKWYAQPGEDRYDFIEHGTYITDQVAAFFHNHQPGQPLAITLQRKPDE